MKQLSLSLLITACFSLLLTSACKKDKEDDGIGLTEDCSASWKVNGTSYSENDMSGCIYLDNTLNISSSTTGGDFFLQISPITSTGTYIADPSNPDLSVVITLKLNDGKTTGILNGSVTVTELSSSKAKGTFSGDFYDLSDLMLSPDYAVTDGVFEANF